MTALLEVTGLDAHYGPIQALRGLSLMIEEGEKVALLGANGAGKSTTLRTISGMIRPSSGKVLFRGEDVTGLPAQVMVEKGLAHLPEGRELFPTTSVEDNLRAGYWVRRKDTAGFATQRDRVMDFFPILRERRNQAAGTLSGGEQQMLGVARALMCDPKLLVIDELSLGLAPLIVAQLFEILHEINRSGTAVVIVEQFVHMALANTDRAYVLAKGNIVLEGASNELLTSPDLISSYLGEAAGGGSAAPAAKAKAKATAKKKPAASRRRVGTR
jgi:branched-chain amino acid transport system ATP-binding protein